MSVYTRKCSKCAEYKPVEGGKMRGKGPAKSFTCKACVK